MTFKILIAEDHENTRKSIVYGLKTFGEFSFVSEAENGIQAIDFALKLRPDVILMDIAMPVKNGIDAAKEIKKALPGSKIIMLTSISEKKYVMDAFASGANAYCMKSIKINELLTVIKMVATGSLWIDSEIAGYVLNFIQENQTDFTEEDKFDFCLTSREKEILKLIATGLSNKDIAEKLILSLHTVKNHVRNIIQKLAVKDRTQAAILALKEQLI